MVTRHDVRSRWSSHSEWKYMFFQLLSTMKVNLVAKIMESAYLCLSFHVKHKKLPFLAVLTWFQPRWRPLLVTSQGSSSATTHKIYAVFLGRSKSILWWQNGFEILQHIKNSGRGPSIYLHSLPTCYLAVCDSWAQTLLRNKDGRVQM